MELRNIKESRNIIENVEANSIANELNIVPGDILLSINENKVKDIIDYKYLISDDYIVLEIEKLNGEIWEFEIEKEFDEDLGIIFTNSLIDKAKSCRNKCIFCFIDQLPTNMRETLYFKDDDSRLSFLQGNFISLTNMNEKEIDRIIDYRLSPINISVHTTNPDLRVHMLKNKNAGNIYNILKRFHQANLQINCQIVLVPGVNDGIELERTLKDLSALYPSVNSIAIVPVGITKYRKGLEELTAYDKLLSEELLEWVYIKQEDFLKNLGTRLVFPSDEFYALSNMELPKYKEYEGFPQLENGVGLIKSLQYEVDLELEKIKEPIITNKKYIIATGTLAYSYIKELATRIMTKFRGLELEVIPIINNYFGDTITVSGLITGVDLIDQLKHKDSNGIIIPRAMMKSDEEIFLDNITLEEVSNELNAKIIVSQVSGHDLINKLSMEVAQ